MRIAFALLLIMFSCSKGENDMLVASAAKTILNQSYGTDAAQKMDIYLPANRSSNSTKVLILIHGGGWSTGDKSASTPFVDTLKHRFPDYAIFNINYRLSTGYINLFPTQELDVKAAFDFIYQHRAEYLVSDKFILAGESAGGHLAMLVAYKYDAPVKAKAVISFFGPSDLADMYTNPPNNNPYISAGLAQVIGATPAENPAIYYSSSPASFISSNTGVPTILFHGGNDPLVSPSQSALVKQKLEEAGLPVSYTLYPGKGHGDDWGTATFTDAFSKIQLFLNTWVQ